MAIKWETEIHYYDYEIFKQTGKKTEVDFENLSKEEKKTRAEKMNDRCMKAGGYIPANELYSII